MAWHIIWRRNYPALHPPLLSGQSNTLSLSSPPGPAAPGAEPTVRSQNSSKFKFSCSTADCGSGTVECNGAGAAHSPPATLAEFTLNGSNGLDFYDVSLVDGHNLPMLVTAQGGTGGNCTATGCVLDLKSQRPKELGVTGGEKGGGERSMRVIKSACDSFGAAEYCCNREYGSSY